MTVRWVEVTVEGHTVEQILLFDVTEAEAVHGRPFDDELDKHLQAGMFATDRISADGTMHKVASATSYVLDGKCMRTAKIEHCRDIQPMSTGWRIERADGKSVHREPWSCVPGTPPTSHGDLKAADDVTRFLRGVGERVISSLRDDQLKPDRKSWWAGSLGYGYRFYHLWYSRPPWDNWDLSYRTNVRRSDGNEPGTGLWHADAGFTYLKSPVFMHFVDDDISQSPQKLGTLSMSIPRLPTTQEHMFKYSGLVSRICEGCCLSHPLASSPVSPS